MTVLLCRQSAFLQHSLRDLTLCALRFALVVACRWNGCSIKQDRPVSGSVHNFARAYILILSSIVLISWCFLIIVTIRLTGSSAAFLRIGSTIGISPIITGIRIRGSIRSKAIIRRGHTMVATRSMCRNRGCARRRGDDDYANKHGERRPQHDQIRQADFRGHVLVSSTGWCREIRWSLNTSSAVSALPGVGEYCVDLNALFGPPGQNPI